MGTPDHNNWLPPAFASYEPHHDRGFNGPTVRHKDHPTGWTRHMESQTRRTLKLRNPTFRSHPHHQSGTYVRLYGGRVEGAETSQRAQRAQRAQRRAQGTGDPERSCKTQKGVSEARPDWLSGLSAGRDGWWALTDSNRRPLPCKGSDQRGVLPSRS